MSVSKNEREALEADFGLAEPVLEDAPVSPHRKRVLLIACACILGRTA